jgi:uncharacterized cupredoxin-like copper-binding protein
VLVVAAAGCGSPRDSGRPPVDVTVRDYGIDAPLTARAGDVRLAVHNDGPDTHEVMVVRSTLPALPLRRDGITVDESAIEDALAGEVEGMHAGATGVKAFHLSPGRYVLFCNMAGHYRGGMHTTLVVR